jgi:helicase
MEELFLKHAGELLVPVPDPDEKPEKFEGLLAELKTAQMLRTWIGEAREESIHERFGVGAGDIRRTAETAEWLLYAAHELASLFKVKKALGVLRKLRTRMRYGVKEELLELVRLRGVGRVRARSLFMAGYKKLADIERAPEQELARVPYIGTETARGIKRQLAGHG